MATTNVAPSDERPSNTTLRRRLCHNHGHLNMSTPTSIINLSHPTDPPSLPSLQTRVSGPFLHKNSTGHPPSSQIRVGGVFSYFSWWCGMRNRSKRRVFGPRYVILIDSLYFYQWRVCFWLMDLINLSRKWVLTGCWCLALSTLVVYCCSRSYPLLLVSWSPRSPSPRSLSKFKLLNNYYCMTSCASCQSLSPYQCNNTT